MQRTLWSYAPGWQNVILSQKHAKGHRNNKRAKGEKEPSTESAETAEEGSGDVIQTTLWRRSNNIEEDGFGETRRPKPACRSQESGGYVVVFALLAFN